MVNQPNPIPPSSNPNPEPSKDVEKKNPNTGMYNSTEGHKFLGMNFTADEWNKLMNIFIRNMSQFISKTFKKMTEKMKKDWARGEGKDVD